MGCNFNPPAYYGLAMNNHRVPMQTNNIGLTTNRHLSLEYQNSMNCSGTINGVAVISPPPNYYYNIHTKELTFGICSIIIGKKLVNI